MWVEKKVYQDIRDAWIKSHEEARVLAQQNTALQTTMDWFRMRINQLEQERSQMLFQYTGVKVPTPTIHEPPVDQALAATMGFEDVGDEVAKKLGIGWNDDGTLKYAK